MGELEQAAFTIPEQKPSAGSFLASPKDVAAWIQDLPIANVGETARKLYKAIYDFNQLAIPGVNRLKIAELFIPPTTYITNNLEKFYSDAAFPLSEKARKIALLTRALNGELATSFKSVLQEQLQKGVDKKIFAFAAHRTLLFTLRVMRQSALTYRNYPAAIWRETHLIYQLAAANQIDRQPLKEPVEKGNESSSVNDLYKRILLFYLSDHYRLRQRDIQNIFLNLPEWSSQARLTLQARMKNPKNQFLIHLRRNAPPVHLSLVEREPNKESVILDTGMLEESLQDLKNKAVVNNLTGLREINGLSEPVIQHLHDVWSTLPERRYSRTQLNFELHIAVGLSAIHALIMESKQQSGGNHDDEPTWPPINQFSNLGDSSDMSDDLDSSFWEHGLDGAGIMPQMDQYTIEQASFASSAEIPNWTRQARAHHTVACKTLNESAGGYCISWKGKSIPRIKIGELVGIRSASRKDRYSLAATRWMKYEKGSILLGIAIISPSCQAVEARLTDEEDVPVRQCLLLTGKKDASPSLVIPPLAFRTQQKVSLYGDGREIRVRLDNLIEGSGAFNQYGYEELAQTKEQPIFPEDELDTPGALGEKVEAQVDSGFAKDDSGFDTIWSIL
ncbi:MAG: hypothetical protein KJ558_11475 [Gammaproteobacteria bacterium]|nr:hypothetical protein [Gammaproteobacteria bacterium]MBU1655425.1 hypothetical protein [Gammaproteobacteria bacterium]MBU1961058.1 hypothetical protein [Gammaproteobacteria bacterium]